MIFFFKAAQIGSLLTATLILESWPIFFALVVRKLVTRQIVALRPIDLALSMLSLVGVGTLIFGDNNTDAALFDMETSLLSVLFAIISMVTMALAVAFKAEATDIINKELGQNPMVSYFIIQVFFVLLLPVFLFF